MTTRDKLTLIGMILAAIAVHPLVRLMKSSIIKIEDISELVIPPGTYQGLWGGYQVIITGKYRLTTKTGVRGFNIPCTVTIHADGSADVEANDKLRDATGEKDHE